MEVLRPSPNAEFLISHVFEKAGQKKAPLFVPVLRRWAREGKEVHGKRFSLREVEEAIALALAARGGDRAQERELPLRQAPLAAAAGGGGAGGGRLDGLPTPARSAAQQASAAPGGLAATAPGSSPPAAPWHGDVAVAAAVPASAPGPSAAAATPPAPARRQASAGELLQHASSRDVLGQPAEAAAAPAAPAAGAAPDEKVSLSLRGARMEIRANPPRLSSSSSSSASAKRAAPGEVVDVPDGGGEGAGGASAPLGPPAKRRRGEEGGGTAAATAAGESGEDDDEVEICLVTFGPLSVPRLALRAAVPRQTLRISAGRAAAAAGIHPYADVGDMFLEFVYQDLPDLLLRDAELAGVEIVSPAVERAKLMAKSGELGALEAALRSAAAAAWVQGARDAQRTVGQLTSGAEQAGRLSAEEAEELKRMLELEINLEFGARHEDAAIEAYSRQVGQEVFGQQRRVSLAMPEAGPECALAQALPPPRASPMPRDEEPRDQARSGGGSGGGSGAAAESSDAYFRLTGFVDGLVDLPRAEGSAVCGQAMETLVVEVKHRIGSIKTPPNLYDVVQLCCYCRVYGLRRGHLVQCLREESPGTPLGLTVGKLHVTSLDFSEGSPDRKGWDQHVLPALYRVAAAVYAARADESIRLRLLGATTPQERAALVGSLCPHLDR